VEVTGTNPVEAQIFFRLLDLSNCLNWEIYCDDYSSLSEYKITSLPVGLKFESTNVLTSIISKGVEVGPLFSLDMALNILDGFITPKIVLHCKTVKKM